MSKKSGAIASTLFILYCMVMLWLLFDRSKGGIRGVNLVPFATIEEFWTVMVQSFGIKGTEILLISSFVNLAGNVLMFIPLGFFVPLLWQKLGKWWLSLSVCGIIIVAVEVLQFATARGSADIDDFILNMLGVAVGYVFFTVFQKIRAR